MKKIIIWFIHLYRLLPFDSHSMCRYTPTCSQYMEEAINEYGLLKGLILGFKRILKCTPWGKFGYDPLPLKEKNI